MINLNLLFQKDEYNIKELNSSSILYFIKKFPNLNKNIFDNQSLFNLEKQLAINKKLDEYFKRN